MNKLALLLVAAFIFFGCEGEQGEPGPAGQDGVDGVDGTNGADGQDGYNPFFQSGFISGTITGTRRDGTAFTETFKYEYADEKTGFKNQGYYHSLEIDRYAENYGEFYNRVYTRFDVFNLETDPTVDPASFYFYVNYSKELSADQLFNVRYNTDLDQEDVEYFIDPTNSTYDFINGALVYDHNYIDGVSYYDFKLKDGSTVRYESSSTNYNSVEGYYYGSFVSLTKLDGTVITTGTIYENLETRWTDFSQFYEAGTPLGLKVTIPADKVEITNFVHNKDKGLLTFDYMITGYGGRWWDNNSTKNDLTITGSAELPVYNEIVGRKAD